MIIFFTVPGVKVWRPDAGRIAILELRIDPEANTTRTTLTDIRNQALAGKGG
ncbi:MAG: hypothetical protein QGI13_08465 [Rhodospirillales bacterium]|jgi:hypothetical protein|nr:hypothetical protein [Rhodospirillales bacterium]